MRTAHAGKKHVSFEPSVYKNGFLPRQARDKHGKTQKDYRFVLQGSCAYRRNLTVAASSDGGASWSIEPWGLIYKGRAVRKRHSLSHFLDHFAKTGSGHTQRNAEQRWKRPFPACRPTLTSWSFQMGTLRWSSSARIQALTNIVTSRSRSSRRRGESIQSKQQARVRHG